jgi:hypothetical protein
MMRGIFPDREFLVREDYTVNISFILWSKMVNDRSFDSDKGKGAVEEEVSTPSTSGRPNLSEQLGHRDEDEILKDSDTDFPEPGSNPEHSGERK